MGDPNWQAELKQRGFVFANKTAGSSASLVGETRDRLRTSCCDLVLTESLEDLDEKLRTVFSQTTNPLLIAAGGDGTVNTLVNAAVRVTGDASFDLGILPLGTGNDLARTFEIPLELMPAIAVLEAGKRRQLDLWLVTSEGADRMMVNAMAIGQPAVVGKETTTEQKKKEGVWSYVKNGALLFSADPAQFTISLNGEPAFEKTGSGLIFSNGKTIAGGLPISPASEPDDKQLELKILEGEGWGEQMMSAVLVLLGGDQEGRSYQNIGSATIESSQPAEVSIDGEVCRKLPVSIRYYKTIEIVAS